MKVAILFARLLAVAALMSMAVWSAANPEIQATGVRAHVLNQKTPGFDIQGVIVDGKTGKPVEGVTVRLRQRGSASPTAVTQTLSDQRGAFTLRAPSEGDYSVSAHLAPTLFGEFSRDPFSQSATKWFTVPRFDKIVVRLWDFPQIAGTVTDETGQPLRGVVVRALYKVALGGRPVLRSVPHTARTDDRGRYVFARLEPRTYVFVATPPAASTPLAFRHQYYVGASQASGATGVRLSPSQVLEGVDFQLRRERGHRVSGVVERKGPIEDSVRVQLYDVSGGELSTDVPVSAATISPEGQFEMIGIARGSYELRFVRFPRWQPKRLGDVPPLFMENSGVAVQPIAPLVEAPTWWTAERIEVVDGDVSVSLRLRDGARVSGRVVFEGQQRPSPETMLTHGIYVRGVHYQFFGPAQLGAARGDGSFITTGLPFGRYVLGMLSPYPGFQLESVRVGGREVAGVSFDLGGDINDAVLVLAARTTAITGRIEGRLNDDRFVLIWPEDRTLWSGAGTELGRIYRAVTTDGLYRLQLYPGAYRVIAMAGLPPEDWESPDYLTSLMSRAQKVIILAGQTVTHNPPLVPRR